MSRHHDQLGKLARPSGRGVRGIHGEGHSWQWRNVATRVIASFFNGLEWTFSRLPRRVGIPLGLEGGAVRIPCNCNE